MVNYIKFSTRTHPDQLICRGDPPHTINNTQPLILSGRPASSLPLDKGESR